MLADVHSPDARRRNMAAIRGQDTTPELLIRHGLHRRGFRYRLQVRDLPGRPDLVLPKHRAVIFVHGCFWHRHDCPMFKWPQTRAAFWRGKIDGNARRDADVRDALLQAGWRIATVWECALKGRGKQPVRHVIDSLALWLSSDTKTFCVEGRWRD